MPAAVPRDVDELAARDIALLRAENPSPMTLSGTNTYLVGRDPTWAIDPGPALEAHLGALEAEIERRGGLAGIALTHDHGDHTEALEPLRARTGRPPVAAARGRVDALLTDGSQFGPLRALPTPGHAPDHLALLRGDVCFTGDAVLGEGSALITPHPGALAAYLAALQRLAELDLALLCPGHGRPVTDPSARLREYIAHRLDRERMLLEALDRGGRSVGELLDGAWSEVPAALRPAATLSLAAHLDKLADEGRLPEGVERPD
jgi:glyoxylase-like metal-dependent hydrolase (beta-lactamase superfamily II)